MPDQSPTIQAALDDVPDTVFVRPGRYLEDLVVSRSVTIMTTPSSADARAEVTTLLFSPVQRDITAIFEGLAVAGQVTLQNDGAYAYLHFSRCDMKSGVVDVFPYGDTVEMTFLRCTIEGSANLVVHNAVSLDSCLISGGVAIGGAYPQVAVRGCSFQGSGGSVGVLVNPADTVILDGNTIRNFALGFHANVDTRAQLTNNTIEDCSCIGMRADHHGIYVHNNVIRRCGVGMDLRTSYSIEVTNNIILACVGMGMSVSSTGEGQVTGNVVADCGGDGLYVEGQFEEPFVVTGNTMARNMGAGLRWNGAIGQGSAEVSRNISYRNGGYGVEWLTADATTVACNDWFGNVAGDVTGRSPSPVDFSVDPQFCDAANGDFHLLSTSPLVDWPNCGRIGALSVGCAVTATLVTRFDAERTADGIRIAWELGGATGAQAWLERSDAGDNGPWIRPATDRSRDGETNIELDGSAEAGRGYWYRLVALEGTSTVVIASPIAVGAVPDLAFVLAPLQPNPASGPVQIGFSLAYTAQIQIDVFDLQGRLVASPAGGMWPAGKHQVEWSGSARGSGAAAGMYLVRYHYPGGEKRRRVIRTP